VEVEKWIEINKNYHVKYYNDTSIGKFSLAFLSKVWADIKNGDVINIQYIFSTTTVAALVYARAFNKPILLTPRGSLCKWCLLQGSKYKKLWLFSFIKPFANSVVWHSTSNQESKDILSIYPKAKIYMIPNGIDYYNYQLHGKISSQYFTKYFFCKDTAPLGKVVVSMGRICKVKGFDILINAFARVLKYYPNSKLIIAGTDEGIRSDLYSQIHRLKLNSEIFIIDAIYGEEKNNFLANADLFALPSHSENFGNVYLESLASGTPIVASTNTPWSDVEINKCGRWVGNDVKEFSDAIVEVLGEDRDTMKENSQIFAKKFDWSTVSHNYKKILEATYNRWDR
jgi:glycosyltransferase involved in cell wall biosynthesis